MDTSIGVNLRVTAHSTQGGRKYMEDMFCVAYQPTADERDLLYAYFGIFDGHGGKEAALFAKHHLMDQIVSQKNFWSEDDALILKAIRDGFINTHFAMWKELDRWPKTPSGLPSTSGTTASIAFVRRGKLYIGHVGDSAITLGYQDPVTGFWKATPLTKDHKPEGTAENARILKCGGKVINKSGVPRVVWNRPRIGHKGPVRRSTTIDEIPFLAVARSLGDLWSYNSAQDEFVVSPVPDVSVVDIDVDSHRCLILGSDGLWNMLNAQEAVNSVYFAEKNNERQLLASPSEISSTHVKNWINPSKRLVDRALDKWYHHNLRADNTSVVTVVIDPPGPPKAQVVRQNQKHYEVRESISSVTDPTTSKTVPAMILAPTQGHGKQVPTIPTLITARQKVTHLRNDIGSQLVTQKIINRPVPNTSNNSTPNSNAASTSHILDQPTSSLRLAKPFTQKRKHELSNSPPPNSIPSVSNTSPQRSQLRANTRTVLTDNVDAVKADAVQIHEISSSSETSKASEEGTEIIGTGTPSKRRKCSPRRGLEVVSSEIPNKRKKSPVPTPEPTVEDKVPEKNVRAAPPTSMITRSTIPVCGRSHLKKIFCTPEVANRRGRGRPRKVVTKKQNTAIVKSTMAKSRALGKSKGMQPMEDNSKPSVASVALSKRSLRSSSEERTRVTRSMKKS